MWGTLWDMNILFVHLGGESKFVSIYDTCNLTYVYYVHFKEEFHLILFNISDIF